MGPPRALPRRRAGGAARQPARHRRPDPDAHRSRPGRRYLYPRGGFGRIPDAYAGALAGAPNVTIRCAAAVESVSWRPPDLDSTCPVITRLRYATPSHPSLSVPVSDLIWTAPVTELIRRLDPPPPESVRRAAARLRYRAVVLCYVTLNVPAVGLPDTYYFPERRFPFNRVTEQKRFSPATVPPDRTVLCMDLACDPHDPTFAATDAGLRALVLPALEEAGLLRLARRRRGVQPALPLRLPHLRPRRRRLPCATSPTGWRVSPTSGWSGARGSSCTTTPTTPCSWATAPPMRSPPGATGAPGRPGWRPSALSAWPIDPRSGGEAGGARVRPHRPAGAGPLRTPGRARAPWRCASGSRSGATP